MARKDRNGDVVVVVDINKLLNRMSQEEVFVVYLKGLGNIYVQVKCGTNLCILLFYLVHKRRKKQ
jgi:hypothetical protein